MRHICSRHKQTFQPLKPNDITQWHVTVLYTHIQPLLLFLYLFYFIFILFIRVKFFSSREIIWLRQVFIFKSPRKNKVEPLNCVFYLPCAFYEILMKNSVDILWFLFNPKTKLVGNSRYIYLHTNKIVKDPYHFHKIKCLSLFVWSY